jgi:serine/threonine protein kinase
MSEDRKSRIAELFHAALALKADQRLAFLKEACGGDADLYREVRELLDSYAEVKTAEPIPAKPAAPLLDEDTRIALAERYEDIELIGHGGMGVVLRAHDRELNHVVALKFLHPSLADDEHAVARFLNEILLAHKVTHKNVCRIYDLKRVNGKIFISMEYVEGETLRNILDRVKGVSVPQGIVWTQEICDGLSAAHDKGIVHRDLKPENIMIDRAGHAKVMDFGIARSIEADRTAGTVIGTPQYMSPEQAMGKALAPATDIYSLGLVLYELFTGVQRDREHPIAPGEANRYLPTHIGNAIQKCLHEDAEHRFKAASQLSAALTNGSKTRRPVGVGAALRVAGICVVPVAIMAVIFAHRNDRMHHDKVYEIAFSPDGRTLASGSQDTTIKLWDVQSQHKKSILTGHEGAICCVTFSADGYWLASGSDDATVRIWSVETGRPSKTLSDPDKKTLAHVALNGDASRLASTTGDTINIWDVRSGRVMHVVKHADKVVAVAFSPDGALLASGSLDRTVKIWDVETGRLEQNLIHEQPVNAVAFSPDGRWLASAMQKEIKMWSRQSWNVVHILSDQDIVDQISFSHDGQRLASDTENYSLTLWMSPWEQQPASRTKVGPDEEVIAFSPDLRYYAVGRNDGTIVLSKLPRD